MLPHAQEPILVQVSRISHVYETLPVEELLFCCLHMRGSQLQQFEVHFSGKLRLWTSIYGAFGHSLTSRERVSTSAGIAAEAPGASLPGVQGARAGVACTLQAARWIAAAAVRALRARTGCAQRRSPGRAAAALCAASSPRLVLPLRPVAGLRAVCRQRYSSGHLQILCHSFLSHIVSAMKRICLSQSDQQSTPSIKSPEMLDARRGNHKGCQEEPRLIITLLSICHASWGQCKAYTNESKEKECTCRARR